MGEDDDASLLNDKMVTGEAGRTVHRGTGPGGNVEKPLIGSIEGMHIGDHHQTTLSHWAPKGGTQRASTGLGRNSEEGEDMSSHDSMPALAEAGGSSDDSGPPPLVELSSSDLNEIEEDSESDTDGIVYNCRTLVGRGGLLLGRPGEPNRTDPIPGQTPGDPDVRRANQMLISMRLLDGGRPIPPPDATPRDPGRQHNLVAELLAANAAYVIGMGSDDGRFNSTPATQVEHGFSRCVI